MIRAREALLSALAVASLLTVPAGATTVVPPTFDELVDNAREIFVGEVVARASRFVDTPQGRAIVTLVTFKIDDSLKGSLQTQTSLEFLGGTVGDVTLEVAGMPQFRVGDRDMLFVGNRSAVSPIVGLAYGRFRIARDPASGTETVRTHSGRAITATAAIGQPETPTLRTLQSMSLDAFRGEVLARIRTQAGRAQ